MLGIVSLGIVHCTDLRTVQGSPWPNAPLLGCVLEYARPRRPIFSGPASHTEFSL